MSEVKEEVKPKRQFLGLPNADLTITQLMGEKVNITISKDKGNVYEQFEKLAEAHKLVESYKKKK